ncbi:SAM-dependent methyltransferase [Fructobacillus pseudoficulneus]|uniref:SAM-dependent methyltransferase n=1 Tax=Fructobacillus pseudoficulneus TaxID=220714 RepID=A0A3F3GT78_9LACO|nr:hypothetical protein [Fructobacillus pseudoficulneus]GAP02721.1 SAM-dependent methyltransferase [Fructobacillus pseudoficulneus]SEH39386.1 hypothetical protein SAMN05660469_0659 [Fructobacillus pseudoficulneus]
MITREKITELTEKYQNRPEALAKIEAVSATLTALDHHQLPQQPLPPLPYSYQALRRQPALLPLDDVLADLRSSLIEQYGLWFLPNQAWLNDLSRWLNHRPLIELMAGNAAISAGLQGLGETVLAVDTFDWLGQDNERPAPWTQVIQDDAQTAVQKAIQRRSPFDFENDPVFLLSWAPDTTEDDWRLLTYLRQHLPDFTLVVIGEKDGATNSKKFWQEAKLDRPKALNQHYQPFDTIQDAVYLAH